MLPKRNHVILTAKPSLVRPPPDANDAALDRPVKIYQIVDKIRASHEHVRSALTEKLQLKMERGSRSEPIVPACPGRGARSEPPARLPGRRWGQRHRLHLRRPSDESQRPFRGIKKGRTFHQNYSSLKQQVANFRPHNAEYCRSLHSTL